MKLHWKIRIWWQELWVRKDEFHKTLDIDTDAVSQMTYERRLQYFKRLEERRDKAHAENKKRNMKSWKKFEVWLRKQTEAEMHKRGLK